jgi:hypothetical protein
MLVRFDCGVVTSVTHRSLEVVRFGLVTVDVARAGCLDEVVEAVDRATAAALLRFPHQALVVRFRLIGALGLETLLSTNIRARHRALHSVSSRCAGRTAIDGFWGDVGQSEVTQLRIDEETIPRRDVV